MAKILKFPTPVKGVALTIDDNFDPEECMPTLIDWVIGIKTLEDATNFIVALYNEGVIFGHTAQGAPKLLQSPYVEELNNGF